MLTVRSTFLGVDPALTVAALGLEASVVIVFTINPGAGVNEILGVAPAGYVFVHVPEVHANKVAVPSLTSTLLAPVTVTT